MSEAVRLATDRPRRSRRLVVATVTSVVAVLLAGGTWFVLGKALSSPSMEATRVSQRCPVPSPAPSAPGTAGNGPLLAEAGYRRLQLCPAGVTPAERAESIALSRDDRAVLIGRINALPAAPLRPECLGAPTYLLVLRNDTEPAVISLDTGPCDTVRFAGAARTGAAEIHRLAETLSDEAQ
ncbi:MAG: hypothetical protein ABW000_15800 [Actinoplanes sp.]